MSKPCNFHRNGILCPQCGQCSLTGCAETCSLKQRDRVDLLHEIAEAQHREIQLGEARSDTFLESAMRKVRMDGIKHVSLSRNNKDFPLATGVLDYFPDALMAVAYVSKVGNDQHNPGEPLHWAKHKSTDEADALMRHLRLRGTLDDDGCLHSAKVAWRALALLQREIESRNRKQEMKGVEIGV